MIRPVANQGSGWSEALLAPVRSTAMTGSSIAAPGAAPMGLDSTGDPNCTVHVSLLGIPAISLPVLNDEGLPLGLQITGFINGDAEMFAAAASIKTLFR